MPSKLTAMINIKVGYNGSRVTERAIRDIRRVRQEAARASGGVGMGGAAARAGGVIGGPRRTGVGVGTGVTGADSAARSPMGRMSGSAAMIGFSKAAHRTEDRHAAKQQANARKTAKVRAAAEARATKDRIRGEKEASKAASRGIREQEKKARDLIREKTRLAKEFERGEKSRVRSIHRLAKAKQTELARQRRAAARASAAAESRSERRAGAAIGLGAGVGLAGAAGVRGTAKVVGIAATFQQAAKDVEIFGKFSRDEAGRLAKEARRLGSITEFTPTQVAEGQLVPARAGQSVQEVLDITGVGLSLTSAAGKEATIRKSLESLVGIMSGFGIESSKAEEVASSLTSTFLNTKTTLDGLSESYVRLAPNAKRARVEIDEMNAILGIAGQSSIAGTVADTQVRALLRGFEGSSGKQSKLLKKLDISFFDEDEVRKNIFDVLDEVKVKVDSMTDKKAAEFFQTVGGERGKTIIGVLLDSLDETSETKNVRKLLARIREDKGFRNERGESFVKDIAVKRRDTTLGTLSKLGSAVTELGLQVGDTLLPTLDDWSEAITKSVNGISEWTKENPELTASMAKVFAVVSATGVAAGTAAVGIGAFKLAMLALGIKGPAVAGAVAGTKAVSGAIGMGRLGLVGALGLLGVALVGTVVAVNLATSARDDFTKRREDEVKKRAKDRELLEGPLRFSGDTERDRIVDLDAAGLAVTQELQALREQTDKFFASPGAKFGDLFTGISNMSKRFVNFGFGTDFDDFTKPELQKLQEQTHANLNFLDKLVNELDIKAKTAGSAIIREEAADVSRALVDQTRELRLFLKRLSLDESKRGDAGVVGEPIKVEVDVKDGRIDTKVTSGGIPSIQSTAGVQ